ncbi:hypothetical protein PJN10_28970, partial [Mycobacterium kansasii]
RQPIDGSGIDTSYLNELHQLEPFRAGGVRRKIEARVCQWIIARLTLWMLSNGNLLIVLYVLGSLIPLIRECPRNLFLQN